MAERRPTDSAPTITWSILWVFWLPLALMWILMGFEQPALNGVIARLPNAPIHLAAFEVAFGLALVIESPILQMLSAATALVVGKRSYRSMLRFMQAWAVGLTVAHIVLSRPAVFFWVTESVLGVHPEVVVPAQQVFTVLIPFAGMVGLRRLWQGALIRAGETGLVARTMVIRLFVTVGGLAAGLVWHRLAPETSPAGHLVGGGSLVLGVIAGAAASWWYFRRRVAPELTEGPGDTVKTIGELMAFYIPLSLTSIMLLVSRPVLAFGISRSIQPLLSLAAWPVVQSLLFIFTSVALSYQEAVVAKMGESQGNEGLLRRFGLLLGLSLTGLLAIMSFSPASTVWFTSVAGLTPDLVAVARPAMMILVGMPMIVTIRSYFSGVLVSRDRTGILGVSVAANTGVLLLPVFLLPSATTLSGAQVAATAFFSANLSQLLVLWYGQYRAARRLARRALQPTV